MAVELRLTDPPHEWCPPMRMAAVSRAAHTTAERIAVPTCGQRTSSTGAVQGLRVSRRALPDEDGTRRRGLRVTTPLRTALDLARIEPLEEAVVCLDGFLVAGLVPLDRVRAAAVGLRGPGCRQIRRAVDRADGLAESPQETRLRLILLSAPIPPPVAQFSVRDEAGFLARVDFAWPEAKVAVEYEGAWHGERRNVARDRRRLNWPTAAGWRVVFVTGADLHDPVQLVARVAAALAAPRYA